METDTKQGPDYLVRRYNLHVARQFMPDLGHALVATGDAGLNKSIQALLRVIFGYEPEIRTVHTLGSVLDGLVENSPELLIIDSLLADKSGIELPSLLGKNSLPEKTVVISRSRLPSDILSLKRCGVADVIHPSQIDSARLCEAYIRVKTFTALSGILTEERAVTRAEVVPLSSRSGQDITPESRLLERA